MIANGGLPAHVSVAVVGAGFGGLAAAYQLRRHGHTDFVVLERGADVGGTWRDNRYPGCACDVPSHLYSFSFAPNPHWSRTFSPQPEIHEYLRSCAKDFDLEPHLHLDTEVLSAVWEERQQAWRLLTNRGEMTAGAVIGAPGPLSEATIPDFPGVTTFRGETFHSSAWRDDIDLAGKRVAVVGTGASAIQLVPKVAEAAAHTTLFQRTPAWVLPRADRAYTRVERRVYRSMPAVQKANRFRIYAQREMAVPAFSGRVRLTAIGEAIGRAHLRLAVPDPALREQLRPDYRLGCKRVLLSNDYYPALCRDDVDVVPGGVCAVTTDGLRDAAGVVHPVDVVIYATGFRVTDTPFSEMVRGRDGRTLAEHWDETGMQAFRGTTVSGFPNLFTIVGPNTGIGHTSIVFMIEQQMRYVMGALDWMRDHRVASIDVDAAAQRHNIAGVQNRLQRTVWNAGGCRSWYLDKHGNNTTLWPGTTLRWAAGMRTFDPLAYRTVGIPRRPLAPTPLTPVEQPVLARQG